MYSIDAGILYILRNLNNIFTRLIPDCKMRINVLRAVHCPHFFPFSTERLSQENAESMKQILLDKLIDTVDFFNNQINTNSPRK